MAWKVSMTAFAQLWAKRTGPAARFSGIRGLIADMVETTARYELAVEAALDRRLQAIIVDEPR